MNKKIASIVLIVLCVLTGIFTFFGANLLWSDVANMGYGVKDANIIASFPLVMTFCQAILGVIYLSRYIRRPQYVKSMTKKYLIIFMCFSLVGIVTSIMSGVMIYHSFVKPYPIPAYCLTMIIINVIFIASGVYFYILTCKKMKDDETKRKFNIFYVLYTFATSIIMFFVFERFGAFLYFPFFIEWSTINLTWPFAITLLVPMSMAVQMFLYNYPKYNEKPLGGLIFAIVNLVLGVSSNVAMGIIEYYNTKAVSAVSPAMAIGRLDCSTITFKLVCGFTLIIGFICLAKAILVFVKSKVGNKEETTVSE